MTPHLFVTALIVGSAAIALWSVQRWSRHAPKSIWTVLAHFLIANALSSAVLPIAAASVPTLGAPAAVMLITFPPLVYFFVACAWLLLFLQRLLSPAR